MEKVHHHYAEFKKQGASHPPSGQQVVRTFVIETDEFGNETIFEEDLIITSVPVQQEISSSAASSTSSDGGHYGSVTPLATAVASGKEKYDPGAYSPEVPAQGGSRGPGNSSGKTIEGSSSLSSATYVLPSSSKSRLGYELSQKINESGASLTSDAASDIENHGSRQKHHELGHDGNGPDRYYGSGQRAVGYGHGNNGPTEKGYGYSQKEYGSGQYVSGGTAASSVSSRTAGAFGHTDAYGLTAGSSIPSVDTFFGDSSGSAISINKGSSLSVAAASSASSEKPYGATRLNGQGSGSSPGRGNASSSSGLSRQNYQYIPSSPTSVETSSSNLSRPVVIVRESASNPAVATSSGSRNNKNSVYEPEPYRLSGNYRPDHSSSTGAASSLDLSGGSETEGPKRLGSGSSSTTTNSGSSVVITIDVGSKSSNSSSSTSEFGLSGRSCGLRICRIIRKHIVVRLKGSSTC